jgi:hypothetical protein
LVEKEREKERGRRCLRWGIVRCIVLFAKRRRWWCGGFVGTVPGQEGQKGVRLKTRDWRMAQRNPFLPLLYGSTGTTGQVTGNQFAIV